LAGYLDEIVVEFEFFSKVITMAYLKMKLYPLSPPSNFKEQFVLLREEHNNEKSLENSP